MPNLPAICQPLLYHTTSVYKHVSPISLRLANHKSSRESSRPERWLSFVVIYRHCLALVLQPSDSGPTQFTGSPCCLQAVPVSTAPHPSRLTPATVSPLLLHKPYTWDWAPSPESWFCLVPSQYSPYISTTFSMYDPKPSADSLVKEQEPLVQLTHTKVYLASEEASKLQGG